MILGLTLIRVVVLFFAIANLGPDEAQYWAWAQHLAFGYFSKPPMIAWLIAGTTAVCGDGEACVRISAPLLHGATSLLVFLITRRLYDERTAAWAGIAFATLPSVFLSAILITTDVPLVFCWAAALYAYDRWLDAREAGGARDTYKWAAITGAAIGAGLLSKYEMIYFFLCAGLHCVFDPRARKALLSPSGLVAFAVAALIISPNLVWNAHEGFATMKHTAANANWKGHLFNPQKLVDFIGSQLGVLGPVLLVTYFLGSMTLRRRMAAGPPGADLFMFLFSAPIFLIVCMQALVSRANANWAGPACVAATILAVAWLVRASDKVWLKVWRARLKIGLWLTVSLGMHLVAGLTLYALLTVPVVINTLVADLGKRMRGWDLLGNEVVRLAAEGHYKAILTDHRGLTAELVYYCRKANIPIVIYDRDGDPNNEFELKVPYKPEIGGPLLYVSYFAHSEPALSRFSDTRLLELYHSPPGRTINRDFTIYSVDHYKG